MKSTYFRLAFTLIIILFCTAKSKTQDFRLGLTASPSLAWMNPKTDGYSSEGNRLGFTYGLLAEVKFSDQYGLATGLHISYLGGKLSYPVNESFNNDSYNQLERSYRLQIIELPLALKMMSNEILAFSIMRKWE